MIDVVAIRERSFPHRLREVSAEELRRATAEELSDRVFAERLMQTATDPQYSFEIGRAMGLLTALRQSLERNKKLAAENRAQWQQYQELVAYLEWNCLSVLTPKDAERLFQSNVILCQITEIDLMGRVSGVYMEYLELPEEFNRFREAMLRGLHFNQERLGQKPIVVAGTPGLPCLQRWIADYDHSAPSSGVGRDLARLTYLNQSQNVRSISGSERELLRVILEVYDRLKFPALPAQRPAFETGHTVPEVLPAAPAVFPEREISGPPSEDLAHGRDVAAALQRESEFEKSVAQEQPALAARVGGEFEELSTAFEEALEHHQTARTVAALRLAVERNQFLQVLREQQEWDFFLPMWLKEQNPARAKAMTANPTSRQSVQMYVQYVLQELLALPENEAARIGVQLGNLFRQHGHPELGALAYYDVVEKKFKWLD